MRQISVLIYYLVYFRGNIFKTWLTEFLEKEMASHSSTLAWKFPWTEKPGRLQSMGSQRVGHDWATSLSFTFVDFYLVCRKVGLYFTKKSDVMSLYPCVIVLIMHSSGLLTEVITLVDFYDIFVETIFPKFSHV